jgi:hypothetical protein
VTQEQPAQLVLDRLVQLVQRVQQVILDLREILAQLVLQAHLHYLKARLIILQI